MQFYERGSTGVEGTRARVCLSLMSWCALSVLSSYGSLPAASVHTRGVSARLVRGAWRRLKNSVSVKLQNWGLLMVVDMSCPVGVQQNHHFPPVNYNCCYHSPQAPTHRLTRTVWFLLPCSQQTTSKNATTTVAIAAAVTARTAMKSAVITGTIASTLIRRASGNKVGVGTPKFS